MNEVPITAIGISQKIEVPCKNEKLTLAEKELVSKPRDNFLVRVDKVGKFYYPKDPKRPMFQDCYFERDEDYDGVFITDAPLKIFFEITRKCNLQCKGCYIPNMSGDNMDMDKIRALIDDAKDSGVLSIQLLGGEPTLHPHFIEVCEYIKSKGISVEAVSNGVRITEDYANKLKGLIDYMAISIDGAEETHNEFRGSSKSYQKAISAFKNLKKAGINTEVLMTVNKTNILDIDTVFNELGNEPDNLYLKIMHMADKMPDFLRSICLSLDEIYELRKKAESLGLGIQAPVTDFNLQGSSAFFGCPGGIITGIIDTSGDVHKCLYIRDESEKLGNVFEKSLKEIWSDTKLRFEEAMSDKCSGCFHKSSCGGFCTLCKTENRFI